MFAFFADSRLLTPNIAQNRVQNCTKLKPKTTKMPNIPSPNNPTFFGAVSGDTFGPKLSQK